MTEVGETEIDTSQVSGGRSKFQSGLTYLEFLTFFSVKYLVCLHISSLFYSPHTHLHEFDQSLTEVSLKSHSDDNNLEVLHFEKSVNRASTFQSQI